MLTMLLAAVLLAQEPANPTQTYLETVTKASAENKRIRIEEARAKAEIELMRSQQRLMEEQRARLAAETRPGKSWGATVDSLLNTEGAKKVALRYTDYVQYEQEMFRLASLLLPSNDITEEQYLESLYLIAKFASFSHSESARPAFAAALAALYSTKAKP